MARATLLISFFALASLPSSLAGPACARKNHGVADCVAICKSRWGWTGSMMGTDPWGSVVKKVDTSESWDAVISQACGSSVVATPTASSVYTSSITESTASPTESVIPAMAAGATTSATSAIITTSATHAPSGSTSSVTKKTTLGLVVSVRHTTSSVARVQTNSVNLPAPSSAATTKAPQNTPAAQKTSAPQNTPVPSPSPAPATGSDDATSNVDIQAYLAGHNSVRAQHGASPLTWNDNLASKAQEWANNCKFVHSGGSLGPFGENLAAGTGPDYDIAAAIKSWTDEVSQYNPNNPVASHFTQVVWKATTEVGCAVQSCSGIFAASFGLAKFFVCEYSVQGNVIGQFAQNVQV